MARASSPHLAGGYWRVRIKGKTYHLGKDQRQAFAKFHRLMAADLEAPTDRPQTVAGVIDAWLTLKPSDDNEWRLRTFAMFAGRLHLDEVDADILTRYALHLRTRYTFKPGGPKSSNKERRTLSPKSVIDRVRTASAVLTWAHEQDWLRRKPTVPKLPKPAYKPRDIPADDVQAAFDRLPKRAGRILRFILATGCRPSEACRLEWKHVHLDKSACVLPEHKTAARTGKPRTIYLTGQAVAVLQSMTPTIGPVFTNRYCRAYKPSGLRSILKRHCNGKTPYSLRHAFAQTAADADTPEEVLSRLLGHTDPATTRHYYEVRDQRAIGAARSIKLPLSEAS